jgi:hypothetical protein
MRLALVIVIAAACTAAVPPTHSIPLPPSEWGEFTLAVYDSTGLVLDGRSLGPGGDGSPEAAVVARPDEREVDVRWIGGACAHRPILSVRGAADDLRLEIVPEPAESGLAPVSCPAVGIFMGVTLTLGQPVEQRAVTLTETR